MATKSRQDFDSTRPVFVSILSSGMNGSLFYPGQEYQLDDIPEAAIAAGVVYQSESSGNTKNTETESTK